MPSATLAMRLKLPLVFFIHSRKKSSKTQPATHRIGACSAESYDFNKWPWWAGKAKPVAIQQLETAGFKEKNGVYDTRDWDAIRNWAKNLLS